MPATQARRASWTTMASQSLRRSLRDSSTRCAGDQNQGRHGHGWIAMTPSGKKRGTPALIAPARPAEALQGTNYGGYRRICNTVGALPFVFQAPPLPRLTKVSFLIWHGNILLYYSLPSILLVTKMHTSRHVLVLDTSILTTSNMDRREYLVWPANKSSVDDFIFFGQS